MLRSSRTIAALAATVFVFTTGSVAQATWSIAIADTETKEVAVGTVTCLTGLDLLGIVPVVVVGKGAAACQAAGDFDGIRRPIIFDGLKAGTSPEDILKALAALPDHERRQYGIADVLGRTITFTGNQTFQWAGGVVGSQGTLVYAIQGNILAGDCVVPAIEQALRSTPGDIPTKMMAAMQAARKAGGDGRCSCSPEEPTKCGCPPYPLKKSGHIGGMIFARIGDADDPECNLYGCADGNYYLRLNVPNAVPANPDPVLHLQVLFDLRRNELKGRPDAIHSTVAFDPKPIPPNGTAKTTMKIALHDWRDQRVTIPIQSLTVTHAPDSAGRSAIGTPINHGDGTFSVPLTAGTKPGLDRFVVTVNDGKRPVILMPNPKLQYFPIGDLNCDGAINTDDVDPFVLALVNRDRYAGSYPNCTCLLADCNGDGAVNNFDIDPFVKLLGGK